MSLLTIPNVFVNGTGPANVADATQVNANFTAVQTAVNNIYPSQILPITTAQATFGATATGVGYKFLANDATAVPLTVSGVSGQSVDIFDVTLTSGGTKAFSVSDVGAAAVGTPNTNGVLGDFSASRSATTGVIYLGSGATTALFLDAVNNQQLLITNLAASAVTTQSSIFNGIINVTAGTANPNLSTGDISLARGVSTAVMYWGSSGTTAGLVDFGVLNVGAFSFRNAAGAFAQVFGTSFTNSSDATLKTNIRPISSAIAKLQALNPVAFDWKHDGTTSLGFLAQEVQNVLPELVSTDTTGLMGVNYAGIIPVLVQAFQELSVAYMATSAALSTLESSYASYVAGHP